jgi:hypothetical protein
MPWVRATIDRWWLAFWFAIVSIPGLILPQFQESSFLVDARVYVDAARTWLAGGDPWSVNLGGLYFAAPPPTLLAVPPCTRAMCFTIAKPSPVPPRSRLRALSTR